MTAQAENIEDYYDYTNRVLGKEMQLNSYPVKETDFIKLKKLKKYLNREEIEILKEIAEIKRKQEPMWGV